MVPCRISYAGTVVSYDGEISSNCVPTFHLKARTDFRQLYLLGRYLHEHMMPKRDEVVFVRECHNTLAVFFWYREEVLQYISYPSTKGRQEVLEDEVGVLFGDGGLLVGGDVMP